MASFEINFDSKGNVLVNNIKGVTGKQCLNLTQPYVEVFGTASETIMLPEANKNVVDNLENS